MALFAMAFHEILQWDAVQRAPAVRNIDVVHVGCYELLRACNCNNLCSHR